MTSKDFEEPRDEQPEGDEVQPGAEGPEADASGPDAQEAETADADALTVDDILGAEQTDEAIGAERADAATAAGDEKHGVEAQLLDDLKRLQAEYANYRRRTEEQREVEIARAKGEAAKGLLTVLDDLSRAEQHGDLVEGSAFAVVAAKVRGVVERIGVVSYGEAGEVFDPQQHEAIFQQPTPGATESTILEVVELGYRLGDVELRPAKVVVAVPAE
jgi:molecular chaperone GrpE